jgi:hypothetical protein
MQRVPKGFFTGDIDIAFEDRAVAYITIFSALGIAWVCDMQRQNYFDLIQENFNQFYSETVEPLGSLNLIEMIEEYK